MSPARVHVTVWLATLKLRAAFRLPLQDRLNEKEAILFGQLFVISPMPAFRTQKIRQLFYFFSAVILIIGCATYGERDLRNFEQDYGHSIPTSPQYKLVKLSDHEYGLTVHQGSPMLSPGHVRGAYLRQAATIIANATCSKRDGVSDTRYYQDGDAGWVHLNGKFSCNQKNSGEVSEPKTNHIQAYVVSPELEKDGAEPQLVLDRESPILRITEPTGERGITRTEFGESVAVVGTAMDASGVAWVRVNGAVATLETNGSFRTKVALKSGENRIVVEAEDIHGNRADAVFTMIRQASVSVADTKLHRLLDSGRWYALVIGIDTYQHLPRLRTATADAKAVAQVLQQDYGFSAKLLLDRQATRKGIVDALNGLRRTISPQDRLLVYYAGHGIFDKDADTAYWLPVDARDDSDTEWILASRITSSLRRLEAKSVLVVADSCYSGTLTRGVVADRRFKRDQFLSQLLTRPSRLLPASGGNEPVSDGGGDGHSVFARALLNGLRRMEAPVFTVGELFQQHVRESVAGNSSQVPQLAVMHNSGHDGGGFVFRRR